MLLNNNACWLLAVALFWACAPTATAQIGSPAGMAQNQAAYLANQNPNFGSAYSAPTVSPYLNFGETPSGVSNYHSLVRPLIDEQDAVARQSATIQRLQRQLRDAREAKPVGSPRSTGKAGSSSAGRFLYYSHYFGPQRER